MKYLLILTILSCLETQVDESSKLVKKDTKNNGSNENKDLTESSLDRTKTEDSVEGISNREAKDLKGSEKDTLNVEEEGEIDKELVSQGDNVNIDELTKEEMSLLAKAYGTQSVLNAQFSIVVFTEARLKNSLNELKALLNPEKYESEEERQKVVAEQDSLDESYKGIHTFLINFHKNLTDSSNYSSFMAFNGNQKEKLLSKGISLIALAEAKIEFLSEYFNAIKDFEIFNIEQSKKDKFGEEYFVKLIEEREIFLDELLKQLGSIRSDLMSEENKKPIFGNREASSNAFAILDNITKAEQELTTFKVKNIENSLKLTVNRQSQTLSSNANQGRRSVENPAISATASPVPTGSVLATPVSSAKELETLRNITILPFPIGSFGSVPATPAINGKVETSDTNSSVKAAASPVNGERSTSAGSVSATPVSSIAAPRVSFT